MGTAVTIRAEGGALLVKGFIKQHKEKTLFLKQEVRDVSGDGN
jgi:hypothetical protein